MNTVVTLSASLAASSGAGAEIPTWAIVMFAVLGVVCVGGFGVSLWNAVAAYREANAKDDA